jgi:hypothetical protein
VSPNPGAFSVVSPDLVRRSLRVVLLALGILGLSACSRVELVYNQLDWLVPIYLESLVELEDDQRGVLEREVEALLTWHCTTHLGEYAGLLRAAGGDIEAGRMTAARVWAYSGRIEDYWRELMREVSPSLARLLSMASDAQVTELFEGLARRNAEARERFIGESPEALREGYVERLQEQAERWVGPLREDQLEQVRVWSEAFEPLGELGMAQRQRWQQRLAELLAQRDQRAVLERGLGELLVQPDRLRLPEYAARIERNRARTVEFITTLVASLDAEQRATLATQVDNYAGAFERLACAPPPPAP